MSNLRPDLRAKIERAKKAAGLAPKEIIEAAKPGAVFAVKDDVIALPEERIEGSGVRTLHETRRAIVVQTMPQCRAARPLTLLVVPCSASAKGPVASCDLEIPQGEPGFDAPRVVAFASLIQPVLKADLDKHYGQISDETLLKLQTVIAVNLDLVQSSTVALPARAARAGDSAG
jgi:mRNA-degrading endonuclease toxin of MazEF toxin-antitoxin module